jgi:hypothetical protein
MGDNILIICLVQKIYFLMLASKNSKKREKVGGIFCGLKLLYFAVNESF